MRRKYFKVISLMAVKDIFIGALVSAFFCFCQWIGGLFSLCSGPTWGKFLYGGLGVFALLFILNMIGAIRHLVRCRRDPVYKDMSERTGISWEDYQKLMDGRNRSS